MKLKVLLKKIISYPIRKNKVDVDSKNMKCLNLSLLQKKFNIKFSCQILLGKIKTRNQNLALKCLEKKIKTFYKGYRLPT